MTSVSEETSVEWVGEQPERCCFCEHDLEYCFVDGVVKRTGGWAFMCRGCHARHGAGFGLGRGQLYEVHPVSGKFMKMEG